MFQGFKSSKTRVMSAVFALAVMGISGTSTALAQEACAITIDGTSYQPDIKKGKRAFLKCRACHTLKPGGRRLTGPNLGLVLEREPLGGEGYSYSKAFQDNPIDWDVDQLSQFLENPRGFMPGSKMLFAGIKSADERANLIAYLREETNPEFQCANDGR